MGKLNQAAFEAHPVQEAARAGQYKLVEKLLMSGHPADSLDDLNRSPLYMACSHLGREAIVTTLLENLPRPLAFHSIKNPLVMAIAIGQLTYVEKLVSAGADINSLRQLQIFFPTDISITPVVFGLNETKTFSKPGRVVQLKNISLIEFAQQLGHTAIADYLEKQTNANTEIEEHSPRSSLSLTSAESESSFASFRSTSSTASSPYSLFRNFPGREAFYSLEERQKQLKEPLLPKNK